MNPLAKSKQVAQREPQVDPQRVQGIPQFSHVGYGGNWRFDRPFGPVDAVYTSGPGIDLSLPILVTDVDKLLIINMLI